MTLVGIIWTLVSFGILIFAIGKQVIISNDEYIAGERYYEIDSCNSTMTAPTEAEKATCKEEKKVRLIASRKATLKTDILSWAIWGILFLALLLVHYPRFMRLNKKD